MSASPRTSVIACLFATVAIAVTACHGSDSVPAAAPVIVGSPSIEMSANARTPLAARLRFSTDRSASRVVLHVSDGIDHWDIAYRVAGTEHDLPVRGLHSGLSHTFSLTVGGNGGTTTTALSDILTPPGLPPGFPALDITLHDGTRLEPGFTLFTPIADDAYVIAIDTFGKVAWFLNVDQSRPIDVRLHSDGNLIFVQDECRIIEMDLEGEVVDAWDTHATGSGVCTDQLAGSTALDIALAHHDVFEMPSGNLLTLSRGDIVVPNYPNSDRFDAGTSEQVVVEDIVIEFARDGTIVRELHLADVLDPARIGYDSVGNINDWAHGNAVIYDERDDSYVFSGRHQDAVVKIGREDGELRWILGTPDGWREPWFSRVLIPMNFSAAQHSWHQHAPEITPDGTLLLFDNGNYRARPYAPKLPATQNYSRAVEYAIDETAMQVTQVWEYGSPATSVDRDYAPFLGDADALPATGNVLITFGGITSDAGVPTDQLGGVKRSARIVEVTHDALPEKLLEIVCGTLHVAGDADCYVYRAEHIDSLVPEYRQM